MCFVGVFFNSVLIISPTHPNNRWCYIHNTEKEQVWLTEKAPIRRTFAPIHSQLNADYIYRGVENIFYDTKMFEPV